MEISKELKEMIKLYEFSEEEFYRHDSNIMLINAKGIQKIIAKHGIKVSLRVHMDSEHGVVVIARAETGTPFETVYSFTEATGEANRGLNTTFRFPVAVAEKRAVSRAVLRYADLYRYGILGDDELDQESEAVGIMNSRRNSVEGATASLLGKIATKKIVEKK